VRFEVDSVIVVQDDVQLRHYPQGHMVCAFGTNQAFEVDGVAALILSNLLSPISVESLLERVCEELVEPIDIARGELFDFIAECLDLNVVRLCPLPSD